MSVSTPRERTPRERTPRERSPRVRRRSPRAARRTGKTKTPEQQRRREFAQSLVTAIACNGLVIALLVFTVVRTAAPPPPALFEVSTRQEPERNAESSGAAPPKPATREEAARGASAPVASMITTTSLQEVSVTPTLQTEFNPNLASVDFLTPAMGASLESSDFAAAENQRKQAIRKFIASHGASGSQGQGIFTIGEEQLRGLFSSNEFGDGSGLVLMTDISGSMREIGEIVDSYVKRTFPESTQSRVVGCSFKYVHDPAVEEVLRSARRGDFTDFVFVCDLQDGEGAVAVERLRKALITPEKTIRFHVISFDLRPGPFLNSLIMDSGGAFTRISRTSKPVAP